MPDTDEEQDTGDGRISIEIMQKLMDFERFGQNSNYFRCFVLKDSLFVQSQKLSMRVGYSYIEGVDERLALAMYSNSMLMLHAELSHQVIVDTCFTVKTILGTGNQLPASVAFELCIIIIIVCHPFIFILFVFPGILLAVVHVMLRSRSSCRCVVVEVSDRW